VTRERLQLGKEGEDLALKKVESLGYRCVARNYRCSLGELDLVARDGETLVFIEIKTRKGKSLDYAKEAVHARKQRQMSKVALAYMKKNGCEEARARFDVVVIHQKGLVREIEVIRNAFDLAYP
jgi:putative endonuclease